MEKIDKKGAYIRLANKNYRTPTEVFTPFLTKKVDHLETLLTIHKPKNILSAGSLCGPLLPSS